MVVNNDTIVTPSRLQGLLGMFFLYSIQSEHLTRTYSSPSEDV
nr:MAG TPA: hypothetical protein [Bacteriophage sp.]